MSRYDWPKMCRWLRTVRHFPVSSLVYRLWLKWAKVWYRPKSLPYPLAEQWQLVWNHLPTEEQSTFLMGFTRWQFQHVPAFQAKCRQQASRLLDDNQGELLNQPFTLFKTVDELSDALSNQTPLWQENYSYLGFLLPVILCLQTDSQDSEIQAECLKFIESQLNLFWQLPFKQRCWSTYGVSRRLLTYCELLPVLTHCSTQFQNLFWQHFYQESRYLVVRLEVDIQGNHLVQNVSAWLAVTLAFNQFPAMQVWTNRWQASLKKIFPLVFERQVLPDGFHYERTPMYHLWVLKDLLESLPRLKALGVEEEVIQPLMPLAQTMSQAAQTMLHCTGQIPQFGDASLPQAPDVAALMSFAQQMVNLPIKTSAQAKPFHYFENAGFTIFRNDAEAPASLVIDCGDFAPRALPAHAHCDLGSFELHGPGGPWIVDAGVSEYAPSAMRDYFRGTAAHNTVWVSGQEQAELWSSFRVAEYPRLQGCQIDTLPDATQLKLSYQNYNRRYAHQRRLTHWAQRFWLIEDTVNLSNLPKHSEPPEVWSLLHLHPHCQIERDGDAFIVDRQLLMIPYGAQQIDYSNEPSWRGCPNLYSEGFNLAKTGQLIAMQPQLNGTFGWVLVPYMSSNEDTKPNWQWWANQLTLALPGVDRPYHLPGLRPCAPSPIASTGLE